MVQLRVLTYLIPRLSQMLGWTVDTNTVADRLLKKEEIVKAHTEIGLRTAELQHKAYQPPPYIPPRVQKLPG